MADKPSSQRVLSTSPRAGLLSESLHRSASSQKARARAARAPRVRRLQLNHFFARCTIFAQVSRNPIVRLNTGFPGAESGSTQK